MNLCLLDVAGLVADHSGDTNTPSACMLPFLRDGFGDILHSAEGIVRVFLHVPG